MSRLAYLTMEKAGAIFLVQLLRIGGRCSLLLNRTAIWVTYLLLAKISGHL